MSACPAGVDAQIAEFLAPRNARHLGPLSGDASTRRYFRIEERGSTRVLALYPEPFDDERPSFVVVRALLAGYGLPVPEIVETDGRRGIMVLQDLGDLTLQEALREAGTGRSEDLYREAVDQLVLLQQESHRSPTRAACFHVAFDIERLSWELHYFEKHFLEGHLGCALSVEDRATLAEGFHCLAEEIASWPRVLCHRDFHSRNLMLHQDTLYWIDFQDARMGPATYDLASLLRDSYVRLPEEFIAEMAEEFRQRAVAGEPRDTFQRRFELMSVQRNLKALGTFGFMASVRGNQVYLPYISPTLANARRNLVRYPELEGVRKVLARHIVEIR